MAVVTRARAIASRLPRRHLGHTQLSFHSPTHDAVPRLRTHLPRLSGMASCDWCLAPIFSGRHMTQRLHGKIGNRLSRRLSAPRLHSNLVYGSPAEDASMRFACPVALRPGDFPLFFLSHGYIWSEGRGGDDQATESLLGNRSLELASSSAASVTGFASSLSLLIRQSPYTTAIGTIDRENDNAMLMGLILLHLPGCDDKKRWV